MSPRANKWKVSVIIIFLLNFSQAFAAENPYKDVDVDRAASHVVKEFNRFDFFESIVSAPDGAIFATHLMEGTIYQLKNDKLSKLRLKGGLPSLHNLIKAFLAVLV